MLRLTKEQRALLADKLPDFAHLAVGAWLFGQFLGERPFSIALALIGAIAWLGLMGLAIVLAGDQET